MLADRNCSIVLPVNDLEAQEIAALAERQGFHVVRLDFDWGQPAALDDKRLHAQSLRDTVVLVETPSEELERTLRDSGKRVHVVDHHFWVASDGRVLDRRNPKSSLEQIQALLGTMLGADHANELRLVAANDRSFWPGLISELRRQKVEDRDIYDRALGIRKKDLAARLSRNPSGEPGRVDTLLKEAVEYLGSAESGHCLRVLGDGLGVSFGENAQPGRELILVKAPQKFRPVMMDALYVWRFGESWQGAKAQIRGLELFVLYVDEAPVEAPNKAQDAPPLTCIEYSGPASSRLQLDDLVEGLRTEESAASRLTLWGGASDEACFFGASSASSLDRQSLSDLADRFLASVLTTNKPLNRWRTHFIVALSQPAPECHQNGQQGEQSKTCKQPRFDKETLKTFRIGLLDTYEADGKTLKGQDQERAYFLPSLRPLITPGRSTDGETDTDIIGAEDDWHDLHNLPKDCSRALKRDNIPIYTFSYREPDFRIEVENPSKWAGDVNAALGAKITELSVHFCYNGVILIDWTCEGKDLSLGKSPYWQTMLEGKTNAISEVSTFGQLLEFNANARYIYSAFSNKGEQRRIRLSGSLDFKDKTTDYALYTDFAAKPPTDPEQPQGWFAALVEIALQDFGLSHKDVRIVDDERARIVSIAIPAGPRALTPGALAMEERLLARFATVEQANDKHFYDADFARAELKRGLYDRFATSEVYPGDGALYVATSHSFVALGYGWFAREFLVHHMARQYRRMFILTQVYSAVFSTVSSELAELSKRRNKANSDVSLADTTRKLRSRFYGFANCLWYEAVSPQIQGRELFSLMMSQSTARADYEELEREMARTDALAADENEKSEAERRRTDALQADQRRDDEEKRRRKVELVISMGAIFAALYAFGGSALSGLPATLVAIVQLTGCSGFNPGSWPGQLGAGLFTVGSILVTALITYFLAVGIAAALQRTRPGASKPDFSKLHADVRGEISELLCNSWRASGWVGRIAVIALALVGLFGWGFFVYDLSAGRIGIAAISDVCSAP